jgi:hypothetical protein
VWLKVLKAQLSFQRGSHNRDCQHVLCVIWLFGGGISAVFCCTSCCDMHVGITTPQSRCFQLSQCVCVTIYLRDFLIAHSLRRVPHTTSAFAVMGVCLAASVLARPPFCSLHLTLMHAVLGMLLISHVHQFCHRAARAHAEYPASALLARSRGLLLTFSRGISVTQHSLFVYGLCLARGGVSNTSCVDLHPCFLYCFWSGPFPEGSSATYSYQLPSGFACCGVQFIVCGAVCCAFTQGG